jgi:hypothetical protein
MSFIDTLTPGPAWVWKIDEAIDICRKVEEALKPVGYHCGLTGGCLRAGHSLKDLDVIIYPRKSNNVKNLSEIMAVLVPLGIILSHPYDHEKYGDDKLVYAAKMGDRTIDLFLLS